MSVQKADVVTKADGTISPLPIENKVVANDINELRRASDDTIDYIADKWYGGLFVCGGDGPAQTVPVDGSVTIDQWDQVQPQKGFSLSPGDISITIAESGVYDVEVHICYETDAKNGDIFVIRGTNDGDPIPGICTRVQHQHSTTTTYEASAGLAVEYATEKTLALEFVGLSLGQSRSVTVKHASLTVRRIDTL